MRFDAEARQFHLMVAAVAGAGDGALPAQVATNSHSAGMIRAFAPLRNVDEWYAAFGVSEGDKNYIPPSERVRIW